MPDTIVSPNDWFVKAGVRLTPDDKLVLPLKCVLLPIHQASICIEKYKKEKDLPQTMNAIGRMQLVQNIGLNVRAADKAYFNEWSDSIIKNNINKEEVIELFGGCKNCFQSSISGNSLREFVSPALKELSDQNNVKIIHAMDSGQVIKGRDFHIVFDYYDEFLKLNLLFFPTTAMSLPKKKCKACIK